MPVKCFKNARRQRCEQLESQKLLIGQHRSVGLRSRVPLGAIYIGPEERQNCHNAAAMGALLIQKSGIRDLCYTGILVLTFSYQNNRVQNHLPCLSFSLFANSTPPSHFL